MTARIRVELDGLKEVRDSLSNLIARSNDLTPAMASIGELLLLSHDERFTSQTAPDGTPWQALSETTQGMKPRNSSLILTLNANLRKLSYNASAKSLEFGSNEPYAAMHQFGGTTSPRSMIPNKQIPARPFLGVSKSDEEGILSALSDYLMQL
ncbi:phage virion morphogenesis protein [Vibrio metschnikovii]|uniref:phage virion morphogenesis protein n=1 Tax=Vibrio sp. A14(2019) TaxID=2591428 RepID=UPI0027C9B668|nr:phage virion morphogenesis protein [Vibrio sp. A14(2019)]MDQ2194455.1 phage virion morphogenesis protein [Vibrio sp. A14(2019)]